MRVKGELNWWTECSTSNQQFLLLHVLNLIFLQECHHFHYFKLLVFFSTHCCYFSVYNKLQILILFPPSDCGCDMEIFNQTEWSHAAKITCQRRMAGKSISISKLPGRLLLSTILLGIITTRLWLAQNFPCLTKFGPSGPVPCQSTQSEASMKLRELFINCVPTPSLIQH